MIEIDASPLNQILFGPPGTGKTHATVDHALAILDPQLLSACKDDAETGRKRLKSRFDELVLQERIRFVTFHQSFSYEDFVEGLRAESDGDSGQLRYEVVDGVFKSLCEAAAAKVTKQAEAPLDLGKRRIWKMSLGNTLGSDAGVYEECVQGGYVLLGYGGGIDFSGCSSRGDVQQRFVDAGVTLDGPSDYSVTSVTAFVTKMKPGDLVVVSDGNFKFRAIGEVAGDYAFKVHPEYDPHYSQMRPVKWLRQYSPSLPHSELLNGQFSQMTLYELRSPTLNREKLQGLLSTPALASVFVPGQTFGRDYQVTRATSELLELKKPNGNVLGFAMSLINELAEAVRSEKIALQDIRDKTAIEKLPGSTLEPYLVNGYNSILAVLVGHLTSTETHKPATAAEANARVLIIDEINRGNISRIFGELITLIEPSKRAGADEALSVVLPYSKQSFSVPQNVYLIGTMNTADRSLAGLDIALRRRFVFREMPARPELLTDVQVDNVNIGELLRAMNQRIEVLLDRDHCLGHAYFMPLRSDKSVGRLAAIFRNQILPLLQEYFFEDWERIRWVLNDQRAHIANTEPFVQRPQSELNLQKLFGDDVVGKVNDQRWELNDAAFGSIDSYRNILG
nr:AAA family ATPase [Pseudomonas sp. DNDY-54]